MITIAGMIGKIRFYPSNLSRVHISTNGEITYFLHFYFNFYDLGSILCWFCCISHFMCACSFIMIAMTFFPLLYIYLRWSEVGITFGCLVFTIERQHMYAFLPRRFSYLHSLIRFFPILITLYSQKINNLNEQKYFSLNLSFLMIWYILRKLIQKKFVVCFFRFFRTFFELCAGTSFGCWWPEM